MDKGDLDRQEAEDPLAGTDEVRMFAGAGDSLFGVSELGDNAKVVAAKGDLAGGEGEGCTDRLGGKEHGVHALEFSSIGIRDARATGAVEGAVAGVVAGREAIL